MEPSFDNVAVPSSIINAGVTSTVVVIINIEKMNFSSYRLITLLTLIVTIAIKLALTLIMVLGIVI